MYTLHQLNYGVCLKIQQLLKFESLHSSVDSRVTLYYLYDSGGKNEWLSLVTQAWGGEAINGYLESYLHACQYRLNMDN